MAASDLLASVESAITALVQDGVASYRLADGREVSRLNLKELMEMRQRLQGEVATQTASGGMVTRTHLSRGGLLG